MGTQPGAAGGWAMKPTRAQTLVSSQPWCCIHSQDMGHHVCVWVSYPVLWLPCLWVFSEFSCFSHIYYASLHCLNSRPLHIRMGVSKRRSLFWGTMGQRDARPPRAALNGMGLPHQPYRPWARTAFPSGPVMSSGYYDAKSCMPRAQDWVLPIQQHLPALLHLRAFTNS